LPPDPELWGTDVLSGVKEDDDWLHDPNFAKKKGFLYGDTGGLSLSLRGLGNIGCLLILALALLTLLCVLPLAISLFTKLM
jgi:beta-glucan synthesis-associated protein KRE6